MFYATHIFVMETEVGNEAEEFVNYLNAVHLQLVLRPQLLPHTEHCFNYKEQLLRDTIINLRRTSYKMSLSLFFFGPILNTIGSCRRRLVRI